LELAILQRMLMNSKMFTYTSHEILLKDILNPGPISCHTRREASQILNTMEQASRAGHLN
jgi:hypothetical protein